MTEFDNSQVGVVTEPRLRPEYVQGPDRSLLNFRSVSLRGLGCVLDRMRGRVGFTGAVLVIGAGGDRSSTRYRMGPEYTNSMAIQEESQQRLRRDLPCAIGFPRARDPAESLKRHPDHLAASERWSER